MVTVSGVPAPEPSAIILLITGFAAGLAYLCGCVKRKV